MHRIISKFAPCVAIGAFAMLTAKDGFCTLTGPGVTMNAYYASDVGCFNGQSYGAITNNCSTSRWVVGTLDVSQNVYHATSVYVYGSSTMCHSVQINGVGNGADVGPDTWTTAGPKTWQNLNTGSRYAFSGTGLLFRCLLEPGGIIGRISVD